MPGALQRAIAALRDGAVVGLPTDTVYGLAVDPMNAAAVQALFRLKGRSQDKPIPVLAADFDEARGLGMIDREVAAHWPGALTVVVHRMPATPAWLGDADANTIALRVPDHPVALGLLETFGTLAVTSANRTGEAPAMDDTTARALFGDTVAAYLEGSAEGRAASTVVDLTGFPARVLRRGPVTWEVDESS